MGDAALYAAPLREQVVLWQSGLEEIDAKIGRLQKGRDDLTAKIEAAQLLLGDAPQRASKLELTGKTLSEALDVVKATAPAPGADRGGAVSALSIMSLLSDGRPRSGPDIVRDLNLPATSRGGHLYRVLKRLIAHGKLVRQGGRYRRAEAAKSGNTELSRRRDAALGEDVTSEVMKDPPPHRSALAQHAAATA